MSSLRLYFALRRVLAITAIQIIAKGVWKGEFAYFAHSENWIDALVVAVSAAYVAAGSQQLRVLRILRVSRALRPLRLVSRFPQLRIVVSAIFKALPHSKDVFVICLLVLYMFAVIGVQAFGGSMSRCTDPTITVASACVGSFNLTGELCAFLPSTAEEVACKVSANGTSFPRLWNTLATQNGIPGESFDNVPRALLTAFELLTGLGDEQGCCNGSDA